MVFNEIPTKTALL